MCDAKKIAKCVYDELHKFIQAAEKRFSWCSCLSRARGWRKIQIFFVSPHFEKRKFSSPLFTNERKFCERRERKLLTSNSHNNSLCVTFCGSLRVIKRVAPTTIAVAIHFPPRPRCLRFRHGLDPLLLLAQRNRICSQISASTRHRSISMSDFAPNRKTLFRTYRDAVVNLCKTIEVAGKFGKSFVRPTTGSCGLITPKQSLVPS